MCVVLTSLLFSTLRTHEARSDLVFLPAIVSLIRCGPIRSDRIQTACLLHALIGPGYVSSGIDLVEFQSCGKILWQDPTYKIFRPKLFSFLSPSTIWHDYQIKKMVGSRLNQCQVWARMAAYSYIFYISCTYRRARICLLCSCIIIIITYKGEKV